MQWLMTVILAMQENIGRRTVVQVQSWTKMQDPYPKTNKSKKGLGTQLKW
jgi:hypothetical protein